jgi:hypothetical protein
MPKNMSGYDRVLRLLLGMFLVAFAISGRIGNWGYVIGLVMLVTASISRCPMYALLGFKVKKSTDG